MEAFIRFIQVTLRVILWLVVGTLLLGIVVLSVNELVSRKFIPAPPWAHTPLIQASWLHVFGGPAHWQTFDWWPKSNSPNQWSTQLFSQWSRVTTSAPTPSATTIPTNSSASAGQLAPPSASGQSASPSTLSAAPSPPPTSFTPSTTPAPNAWQQFTQEISGVWRQTQAVGGAVQTFVKTQLVTTTPTGSADPNAPQSSPSGSLEQRTLEYAKYLYCKETVKAYEQQNPGVVSTNASSSAAQP